MVGDQLRVTREALGLTLDAMAGRIGVSRSQLSRIERNLRTPTDQLIANIDKEARSSGIESGLLDNILISDECVMFVARFFLDEDISETRKAAVRRMIHTLIRSE